MEDEELIFITRQADDEYEELGILSLIMNSNMSMSSESTNTTRFLEMFMLDWNVVLAAMAYPVPTPAYLQIWA